MLVKYANNRKKKRLEENRIHTEASRKDSSSSIHSYQFSARMMTEEDAEPLELFSQLNKAEISYLNKFIIP